ncbi:hypothetical protein J2128_002326 [Methanomicrobium sp. W14]|uniref:hypothetical protein n=1 Tax=Methanomicrobium sp. W14 TaxID=2817839 RepID=UPI001AEA9032|nr:hypothetical protein [Methanomicrobium sp. W14]MBP2134360.1 hypothetical protein [Methanomicrobium sp. W14]
MVFEETLVFYSLNDAEEFSKRLREKGIRVKTKSVRTLVSDTVYKAGIKNFRDFILEESKALNKNTDEIAAFFKEVYSAALNDLESLEKNVSEFLDLRDDKECISEDPGAGVLNENGEIPGTNEETDVTDGTNSKSGYADNSEPLMKDVIPVLDENGMIETVDGKKYLRKTKCANELLISLPCDVIFEGSSEENRKKYGIKTIVNVMSGFECQVTTPPEFAFSTAFADVDTLTEGLDVDENSYLHLKENISLKTLIAQKVLEFLEKTEKASSEEIALEIKNAGFSFHETGDEFIFDLEKEYVADILQDMKKLDLIKGKGDRFRARTGSNCE